MKAKFPAARRALVLAAAGLILTACGSGGTSSPGGSAGPTSRATSPAGGNGGGSGSGGNAGGSGNGSGTALFPVAVGNTWVYNIRLGSLGHGTTTSKIVSVKPVSGGHRVTMTVTDKIPGLPTPTTSLAYIFHPDGSITVPYAQTANAQVTITSGSIVWPSRAVLDSGKPHKSRLVLRLTVSGQTLTVDANLTVQGGGTESVTVPAGTYRATVVNETVAEKIAGVSVSTVVRTWLAPGVGPVKSEVTATSNNVSQIAAVDELKSFTKG